MKKCILSPIPIDYRVEICLEGREMETMQESRTDEVVAESIAILAMIASEAPTEWTPAFPIAIPKELWTHKAVTPITHITIDESVPQSFQMKWRGSVGLGFAPFAGLALEQVAVSGPLATASLWWLATIIPAVGWTAWNARCHN